MDRYCTAHSRRTTEWLVRENTGGATRRLILQNFAGNFRNLFRAFDNDINSYPFCLIAVRPQRNQIERYNVHAKIKFEISRIYLAPLFFVPQAI